MLFQKDGGKLRWLIGKEPSSVEEKREKGGEHPVMPLSPRPLLNTRSCSPQEPIPLQPHIQHA